LRSRSPERRALTPPPARTSADTPGEAGVLHLMCGGLLEDGGRARGAVAVDGRPGQRERCRARATAWSPRTRVAAADAAMNAIQPATITGAGGASTTGHQGTGVTNSTPATSTHSRRISGLPSPVFGPGVGTRVGSRPCTHATTPLETRPSAGSTEPCSW
jgi:hypothetical protein